MLRAVKDSVQPPHRCRTLALEPPLTLRGMRTLLAAIWLLPTRLRAGWLMLLVAAAGVVGASTLLAAAPIYAGAMSDLGVQFRLRQELADRTLQSVTLEGLLVTPQALAQRGALDRILDARLGWLGDG